MKNTQAAKLFKEGKFILARTLYNEAIALNPNSAIYYSNRAACNMNLDDLNTVLYDLDKSISLDETYLRAYTRKMNYFLLIGDLVKCEELLGKIKEIDKDKNSINQLELNLNQIKHNLSLFEKAAEKQDFRMALFHIEKVLQQSKSSTKLRLKKAECLAYLARHNEVLDIVDQIIRKDSTSTEAYFIRGLSLFYQDNLDKSIEHFKQALRIEPDHKKSSNFFKKIKTIKQLKDQGKEAVAKNELDKAIQYYKEALEIEPLNKISNSKLCFNLSVVYGRQKKTKEALEQCTKAIDLAENNFLYDKAYMKRATLYDNLEMYEESVRDYEFLYKKLKTRELKDQLEKAKMLLMRSKHKNYYKILGVSKDANESEIKKAYKRKAMEYHPDKHANASEEDRLEQEKKFKDVSEAYHTLSDPNKKRNYDNGIDPNGQTQFDFNNMRHWTNQDIFEQVFASFGRP